MSLDQYAGPVRDEIERLYGRTSDLSEELVNALTNLTYFKVKAEQQEYGGLTDLQAIYPAKSKTELLDRYLRHMKHVTSASMHLPGAIQQLRRIRTDSPELGDVFERVTVDIFKYEVEDALNKTQIQRDNERRSATPAEHPGLARLFLIPFRRE